MKLGYLYSPLFLEHAEPGHPESPQRLKAILAAMFLGIILVFREKILYYLLPAFFTLYLIYGFIRPRISRRVRHEIEEEDDEMDDISPQT